MGILRRHDPRADALAEVLGLIEDGLEPDFVLPLYGEDAAWLRPLVETALALRESAQREEPSYYFEAVLKGRVLAAAARSREAGRAVARPSWRTALAASAVLAVAGSLGTVMVGAITADTALPGDWNYPFKLANERVAFSLSRGEERIGVQLDVTYARLREAEALAAEGKVSEELLQRIESEAQQLGELVESKPLAEDQKARLAALSQTAETVAKTVAAARPDLAPAAERTVRLVNDVVTAGLGSPTPVVTPTTTPSATPASEPTEEPTAEPSPSTQPGTPSEVTENGAAAPSGTSAGERFETPTP